MHRWIKARKVRVGMIILGSTPRAYGPARAEVRKVETIGTSHPLYRFTFRMAPWEGWVAQPDARIKIEVAE